MSSQSLEGLEIRPSGDSSFSFFYDTINRRLVKDFRLADKPQVALYCGVHLIASGNKYSPRIRLWKRDKTKKAVHDFDAGNIRSAHIIKALVDTSAGHENFLKLMAYVVGLSEIEISGQALKTVEASDADILGILKERSRDEIVPIMSAALGGPLTKDEIAILSGRKEHLVEFGQLLYTNGFIDGIAETSQRTIEAIWQDFFERATWIFGYGLSLISHSAMDDGKLERITVGNNLWSGAGKRSDAIMHSRAQVSTLLFCEIKRHDTPLLQTTAYREPDVFAPSKELVGGVAQVQKTVRKSFQLLQNQIEQLISPDGSPTGLDFSTTKPRQVLVIGDLREFHVNEGVNGEKMESFELYRRSISDVEVITFDELYARARFILDG
ncbi:DUF4263 domain-containing protein [Rathayibacter caricis]|uniref:Shedu immune nuclease family protein n=1 Tax=Rathayibacter caricis TaxID=110936 RepID=UPI001FB1F85F|nr:Shedu immune nuclease family protein [Rathayibacter caricis]MCJ1697473.1 DUF4263 domain-containing protein [Rathayibacter caricis]